MSLQKARMSNAIDTLQYYSKSFSILTTWDGGDYYEMGVYNVVTGDVADLLTMRGTIQEVDKAFELLKTKYILLGI